MKLRRLFLAAEPHPAVRTLYRSVVDQSRMPVFYARLGVQDSPDGRFDMIVLHMVLLLSRLRQGGKETGALTQNLFDYMFADMDQNLREMGVGDLAVGRRIKAMAQGFYGRLAAYDKAIESGQPQNISASLHRNLYRTGAPTNTQLDVMAAYVLREAEALGRQSLEDLMNGTVRFGEPDLPEV